MTTIMTEQRQRYLKVKVALAMYSEYGHIPKEAEIDHVYHLSRVLYTAVLGTHYLRRQQKKSGQLVLFQAHRISMLIGYARVSTQDQTLDLQTDALTQAGCEKIFKDMTSGAKVERPGLQEAMNHLRAGDTLVVWRLDRLGRTLKHLIATVTELSEQEIGFMSLQEHIDITTSGGKLIFHIFGALAEFEREIIRERTNAGLQAARARGKLGGRPTMQVRDPQKVALARKLYADPTMPVQQNCATLQIGRRTLYRYLRAERVAAGHRLASGPR